MEHKRYEKFNAKDYISSWVAMLFLLFLTAFCLFATELSWLSFFPLTLVVVMTWAIYSPHRERFFISGTSLTIIRGKTRQNVIIPDEPVLVIAYADVCPSFVKRISSGNQTHLLKDRWSVSILQNVPFETVLNHIHRDRAFRYTTSMVEASFLEHQYVYDFVCNKELLEELISNRHCQIIVPKSLLGKVPIVSNQSKFFIDESY